MPRQMNVTELHEFYHHIGAALWQIQYLEDALVSFLALKVCKERGDTTAAGRQKLLAEKRKLTLGPLIDACVKYQIIRPQEQSRLMSFKLERHWLVHRSLVESGDKLYDDAGRQAVFTRIAAIRDEANCLKGIAFEDLQSWAEAEGVSPAAVEKHAQEELRRLKGSPARSFPRGAQ